MKKIGSSEYESIEVTTTAQSLVPAHLKSNGILHTVDAHIIVDRWGMGNAFVFLSLLFSIAAGSPLL